jgi:predicted transcriptional regulator
MLIVTLKPDVAEQVRQLAEGAQTKAEIIVDEALRTYLAQARREKLEGEARAFEQQRADLLHRYAGEYVAIDKGQVIDHDVDVRALHLRVFAKLAHTPVLLKLVTDQPDHELVMRSPRFERPAQ